MKLKNTRPFASMTVQVYDLNNLIFSYFTCHFNQIGPPAIGTIAQRNNFVIWGQDSSGVLCNWNTNGQHCPQRVVRNNWVCDSALSENSEAIWLSPEVGPFLEKRL